MTSAFFRLSLTDNFKTLTGKNRQEALFHLFHCCFLISSVRGRVNEKLRRIFYFMVFTSYSSFRNKKYKRVKRKIIFKGINQSTNAQFKNLKKHPSC
jgi:hypothetical protein